VERREARRSALWAGSSLPLEGPARSQGRPRVRRSAPAPFGAPLPHVCEGDLPSRAEGMEMPALPRLARTGAAELWHFPRGLFET
jgi:hypothetical protein